MKNHRSEDGVMSDSDDSDRSTSESSVSTTRSDQLKLALDYISSQPESDCRSAVKAFEQALVMKNDPSLDADISRGAMKIAKKKVIKAYNDCLESLEKLISEYEAKATATLVSSSAPNHKASSRLQLRRIPRLLPLLRFPLQQPQLRPRAMVRHRTSASQCRHPL